MLFNFRVHSTGLGKYIASHGGAAAAVGQTALLVPMGTKSLCSRAVS